MFMMTERDAAKGPTLLSCLDPRRPGLRLCLYDVEGRPGEVHTAVPGESGGYTALVHATVGADGEHALSDFFCLVQPQRYYTRRSELQPVTNADIDDLWQAAFTRLREQPDGWRLPALPEQVDDQGRLRSCRPLLYCCFTNRYAHVLCPRCGSGLGLCRDDQLLAASGLAAYAESLERYLFCPACHQNGEEALFYTLQASPAGAGRLRGCDHLVASFDRLLKRPDLAEDLPCIGCDAAGDCYGAGALVRQRLQPLFFYPFFMLMQPAPTINLLDFLALLSGDAFEAVAGKASQRQKTGSVERLAQHRDLLSSANRFLFAGDHRLFGEVLYLKLTLLDELVGLSLRTPELLAGPAAEMSLARFWVHLPIRTTRLPLFWNFSLRLIDVVGQPLKAGQGGGLPLERIRHFLGTAWFYALLVNDRQPMVVVENALNRLVSDPAAAARLAEGGLGGIDQVFAAHHLLRTKDMLPVDSSWEGLWRRAVILGLELLQCARAPEWTADDFHRRLDGLRRDIHARLFDPAASQSAAMPEETAQNHSGTSGGDDQHIARILQSILEQWPSAPSGPPLAPEPAGDAAASPPASPAEKPKAQALPNEDGDFEETVILGAEAADDPDAAVAANAHRDDDLEETVLMGSARSENAPGPPPCGLEKTVILSCPRNDRVASTPSVETERTVVASRPMDNRPAGGDLEKTMVMNPGANGRPTAQPVSRKRADGQTRAGGQPPERDDLEQTVILRPDMVNKRKPQP